MSIKLSPYLNFNGNTKEAMEFYKQVFGGELKLTTFGETPGMPFPDGYEDKIMHAELTSDEITVMASEGEPNNPTKFGDNISISLSGAAADDEKLNQYFNALCEGGEVTMPLEDAPWGDKFGMCKDQFGIYWLVNIAKA